MLGVYCRFGNFRKNFIFPNSIRYISDVKNSRLRHDLPISINDRVILPFREGFIFTKLRKSSRKFQNLQYLCNRRTKSFDLIFVRFNNILVMSGHFSRLAQIKCLAQGQTGCLWNLNPLPLPHGPYTLPTELRCSP